MTRNRGYHTAALVWNTAAAAWRVVVVGSVIGDPKPIDTADELTGTGWTPLLPSPVAFEGHHWMTYIGGPGSKIVAGGGLLPTGFQSVQSAAFSM